MHLGFIAARRIHGLEFDRNKLLKSAVCPKSGENPIDKIPASFASARQAKLLAPVLSEHHHVSTITEGISRLSAQPHALTKSVVHDVQKNLVIFTMHSVWTRQ